MSVWLPQGRPPPRAVFSTLVLCSPKQCSEILHQSVHPGTLISCTKWTCASHSYGLSTTSCSFKFMTQTHTSSASILHNVHPSAIPSHYMLSSTTAWAGTSQLHDLTLTSREGALSLGLPSKLTQTDLLVSCSVRGSSATRPRGPQTGQLCQIQRPYFLSNMPV